VPRKTSNIDQFEREINDNVRLTVARFVQFHKAVSLDAYRSIIEGSPVCTGRYRASHTIAQDVPDDTVAPPSDSKKCDGSIRAPSLAQAQLNLIGLRPFSVVWIGNALPYASALEYGHSDQAPNGVYEVTLASIESKYDNVEL